MADKLDDIVDKAQELKSQFQGGDVESFSLASKMFEQARRLKLVESLKENDGIKFLLEHFGRDVIDVNNTLLSAGSDELTDRQRDRLIDKRTLILNFIRLFENNEQRLKNLESKIDYNLEVFNK